MPLYKHEEQDIGIELKLIFKWQRLLQLENWKITHQNIQKEQVTFPDDISEKDRFFVGINIEWEKKYGLIYHDRELTEEDILHELLHVKYPEESEESINVLTGLLLLNVGEGLP